jgi:tight adherence protein C
MMWLYVAIFFTFVLAGISAAGFLWLRLSEGPAATADGNGGATGVMAALSRTFFRLGQKVPLTGKQVETVRERLFRAGFRSPAATTIFAGSRIGVACAMALAVFWSASGRGEAGGAFLAALCGGGFGFLVPERWLDWKVRRRAARVRSGLCPAIDLMTLAIEAGQGLDAAMLDTARSLWIAYPELSEEFVFCHLEMKAGKGRAEALKNLGSRSADEELSKLAAVLIDGERFGTSLGPALRTHSRFLRSKMRFAAQESARKLTVKLVMPVFFLIFPSVLLVTLGPAYLQLRNFFSSLL